MASEFGFLLILKIYIYWNIPCKLKQNLVSKFKVFFSWIKVSYNNIRENWEKKWNEIEYVAAAFGSNINSRQGFTEIREDVVEIRADPYRTQINKKSAIRGNLKNLTNFELLNPNPTLVSFHHARNFVILRISWLASENWFFEFRGKIIRDLSKI